MAEFLFLIRHFDYGGAQRQLISLARAVRHRGGVVRVAVFYPGGPLWGELEKEGIPIVSLEKSSRWDVVGFIRRLAVLIIKTKPKVLHSYLGSSNILAVLMKLYWPSVRIVWGVRTSNMEWNRYGLLDRLLYRIECWLSRFADLIIVNSHAGHQYAMRHGFPKEKMLVISNGIDVKRFYSTPEAGKRFRETHGIDPYKILIGLVGRLDPMKGHGTFLKAAAFLEQVRPDVQFICVGDGPEPYRERLHRLSSRLGLDKKVVWLNECVHIEDVYNAMDVSTSSASYGEGFPNSIGEAMACQVVCVVTDVGDSKWIVDDTGRVVPPNDARALVSAWRSLIDMDISARANLGRAARERIVQHFGVDRMIEYSVKALGL